MATPPVVRDPGGTPAQGRELRARGKRTLAALLDAGAVVFASRGYHAARVDDIVRAAKTSHGTFYLYFSSKEDLFRALALDVAAEMVDLARELPSLTPDGSDTLGAMRAWLDRFGEFYGRHGAFIRTWTEAEIGDTDLGRIGDDLVTEFSRQMAMRVRDAAPDLHAGLTAFALVSMIERTSYYVESRQLQTDPGAAHEVMAAVTQAALGHAAT
ncbi:MAG TPA: helix-turn-helix domain-containing protein [Acidimicrobiia bacterium]|nr:helix-turn-helix domain-containing protein [Acidimicrobiia bacterium]